MWWLAITEMKIIKGYGSQVNPQHFCSHNMLQWCQTWSQSRQAGSAANTDQPDEAPGEDGAAERRQARGEEPERSGLMMGRKLS